MEVKGSEAQGRHREVGSEGSVEQRYGLMDKNRIGGLRRRTSWQLTTKSVSIKDAGGKSGGRFTGSEDGEAETETCRAAKPLWRTTNRTSGPRGLNSLNRRMRTRMMYGGCAGNKSVWSSE
jgi:hypothetical protein